VVREMAMATREALGPERLVWLRDLPRVQIHKPMALVHASPETVWRSPGPDAGDAEIKSVYEPLGQPIAVFAHLHRPFIRRVPGLTIVNSGSVSLSYDGDPRAAYLLLDGFTPAIRRVEYDVEKEVGALTGRAFPHAEWVARTLRSAAPQMP